MDEPRPQLVAQQRGVPQFDQLFADHYGFVVRTLQHFGLAAAAAEDAAQDVFVIIHRKLPEYDGHSSMRSWLWGFARRVAAGYRRGEVRAKRRLRVVPEPTPAPALDDALAKREAAAAVEAFLATLRPKFREVFILADIEGMAAPAIADTLGIKLNTVYSRLRTARERFARAAAAHRARARRGEHG